MGASLFRFKASFMRYFTKRRKRRYDDLVCKECLGEPMTSEEKLELDDLQQIRDDQIDRDLERKIPGWRQREAERSQMLQQAIQLLERYNKEPDTELLKQVTGLFNQYNESSA